MKNKKTAVAAFVATLGGLVVGVLCVAAVALYMAFDAKGAW